MKGTLLGIGVAILLLAPSVRGDSLGDNLCQQVQGQAIWALIPSPNDPIGRILGPATGDLQAAISAFLTSLQPQPDGTIETTSLEVWMLGAQDLIVFNGHAIFTPLAGQPIGTINDKNTLTIAFGTGKFAGATGTVEVRGTGYNIFGPNAGPGKGFFQVSYSGNLCGAIPFSPNPQH